MPLCTPHTIESDLQDPAAKPHSGTGRGGPCTWPIILTQMRGRGGESVREHVMRVGNNTLLTTEYEYMENGIEAI